MTHDSLPEYPSESTVPGYWLDHEYAPSSMTFAMGDAPWDARLIDHIGRHLSQEEHAEGAYKALAAMGDPQVAYLARLIAADELRHHAMLTGLLSSVENVANETHDELSLGTGPALEVEQRDALTQAVRQLIELEKNDAAELKQLQRDMREVPEGTAWPVLVEIMVLDTEKHLRILRAIERILKHRRVRRSSASGVA